jgi:hypothetical protein
MYIMLAGMLAAAAIGAVCGMGWDDEGNDDGAIYLQKKRDDARKKNRKIDKNC